MTPRKQSHWLLNKKNIIAAIVFLSTSVPTGLWQAWVYLDQREQDEAERALSLKNNLRSIEQIYDNLNDILFKTSSNKVVLMRLQDSGEIPMPGKDLFSSIVYEVHDRNTGGNKNAWQRQRVDGPYIKLLSKVASNNFLRIETPDLQPSMLKDVFQANLIKTAYVYSIHQEPSYFFYVSIVWKEIHELTPTERVAIKIHIDNIRGIFEERKKYLRLLVDE